MGACITTNSEDSFDMADILGESKDFIKDEDPESELDLSVLIFVLGKFFSVLRVFELDV